MNTTLQRREYQAPPVNRSEILRYAGAKETDDALIELMEDCLREALPVCSYRVVWRSYPLCTDGDLLDLGFARTESRDLRRALRGCDGIIAFAATVGLGIDRLITRYSRLSPARALLFQAIGAERIESLCDTFCRDLCAQHAENGRYLTPRFSPGYGDLPLGLQKDLFRVLDCSRAIALTLNESLLMSPTKSVTALIGLRKEPMNHAAHGCKACSKADCAYRRSL